MQKLSVAQLFGNIDGETAAKEVEYELAKNKTINEAASVFIAATEYLPPSAGDLRDVDVIRAYVRATMARACGCSPLSEANARKIAAQLSVIYIQEFILAYSAAMIGDTQH